jgi:hypothetical protein
MSEQRTENSGTGGNATTETGAASASSRGKGSASDGDRVCSETSARTSNPHNDLVQRLRLRLIRITLPDKDCHDAADEIERLQRERSDFIRAQQEDAERLYQLQKRCDELDKFNTGLAMESHAVQECERLRRELTEANEHCRVANNDREADADEIERQHALIVDLREAVGKAQGECHQLRTALERIAQPHKEWMNITEAAAIARETLADRDPTASKDHDVARAGTAHETSVQHEDGAAFVGPSMTEDDLRTLWSLTQTLAHGDMSLASDRIHTLQTALEWIALNGDGKSARMAAVALGGHVHDHE